MSDVLLTVKQVAERLQVDQTTVRRWIKDGTLDALAMPHKGKRNFYRVPLDSLCGQLAEYSVQAKESSLITKEHLKEVLDYPALPRPKKRVLETVESVLEPVPAL